MDASFLRIWVLCLLILAGAGLARGSEVAIASDMEINTEVAGDVLIVGGALHLGPNARIHGDVISIFGTIDRSPLTLIDGRVLHLEQLASLDPQFTTYSHQRISIFLLTAGFWLLATSTLGFLMRKNLGRALFQLRLLRWRLLPFAILTQLTVIGALIATLGLGPDLAAPSTGIVLAFALGIKALGMTLLGWLVGTLIIPSHPSIPPNAKVFAGVLLFNLLRLIPGLGGILWMLTSILSLAAGILVLGARGSALARTSHRFS